MKKMNRFCNMELLTLPNCQGLKEDGKCKWRSGVICEGEECSLYKSFNRLRSLDEETQKLISRKYYNGTYPWRL